jgi:hypothetical protein
MQNETKNSATAENTFSKKIGRATYSVQVFFSKRSKESFNDKLLRLIKNDVANGTKQA